MNDNEGEVSEELRVLVDGVNDIMKVLNGHDNAHVAMQILAASASCLLCSMVSNEQNVQEEYEMFVEAINRSVMLAKKNNMTSWIIGTPH